MHWYATSATAKMCGGLAVRLAPMYIFVYCEEKRVEKKKKKTLMKRLVQCSGGGDKLWRSSELHSKHY